MTPCLTLDLRTVVAAVGLAALSGCYARSNPATERQPATTSAMPAGPNCPIAVIDLDRVAQGIGAMDKIRSAMRQFEKSAIADLQDATATLFGATTPMGDDFDAFDKSAAPLVAAMPADRQREYSQHRLAAQNQLRTRERQLREDFLGEVRPIAFQIAHDQNCQLVLTTDQVYVATAQVDITPEVVSRIANINSSAAASPLPQPAAESSAKLASGGSFPIK